jgi:hypothetical protein
MDCSVLSNRHLRRVRISSIHSFLNKLGCDVYFEVWNLVDQLSQVGV